jgi:hypothetical protein
MKSCILSLARTKRFTKGVLILDELRNDNFCLTCIYAELKNEDENGNPEYIKCNLKTKEMPIDGFCKSFA